MARSIVIQPDGKILVTGYFDSFAGTPRQKIARLLPDGALDLTFSPPQFPDAASVVVWKAVPMPDGKILIGGNFDSVRNLGFARLNSDGSVDSTFQAAGYTRLGILRDILIQNDGKIVLGGVFRFGTQFQARFAPLFRLNADGSPDTAYVYTTNISNPITRDLVPQPDGKVVAAVGSSIYRFNEDGSRDTTFRQPVLLNTTYLVQDPPVAGAAFSICLQPDGRILFGGSFTDVDPPDGAPPDGSHFAVARLNPDGTLDPTLSTAHKTSFEIAPASFSRLADGSTLVGFNSPFQKVAPDMPYNVSRLNNDGSFDSSFSPGPLAPAGFLSPLFLAQGFEQMADGKFLLSGMADGQFAYGRVLPNGNRDTSFVVETFPPSFQSALALPDGKALLSAGVDPQATADGPLSRLRKNGGLDASFAAASVRAAQLVRATGWELTKMAAGIRIMAVQPDGKILVEYLATDELVHLVRLNPDGSVDDAFVATTLVPRNLALNFYFFVYDRQAGNYDAPVDGVLTADLPLLDAFVQPDGRIILVGRFTSFNGVAARGIVRLQPDGTVDNTFAAGGGAQWTETHETAAFYPVVEAIAEQNDGKLLLAGTFEAFDGVLAPGIVSLNADGAIDSAFTPPAVRQKFSREATKLARQADGSFLLAGAYSFPEETETSFIRIDSLGGVPIVGGPPLATAAVEQAFSYQIVASGQPTKYGATGLPPGFNIDPATGVISGNPTSGDLGVFPISLTATNAEGSSAPRRLTLTIQDSASPVPLFAVFSQKVHNGAERYIALPLEGNPGIECRTGGANGDHTVIFTFFNSLTSVGGASVTNGTGSVSSSDMGSGGYIVNLTGATNAQIITITLANVNDSAGSQSSTVSVPMGVLLGDMSADGVVNSADITQTRRQSGQLNTQSNFRTDLSIDGVINCADITLARRASGTALP